MSEQAYRSLDQFFTDGPPIYQYLDSAKHKRQHQLTTDPAVIALCDAAKMSPLFGAFIGSVLGYESVDMAIDDSWSMIWPECGEEESIKKGIPATYDTSRWKQAQEYTRNMVNLLTGLRKIKEPQ